MEFKNLQTRLFFNQEDIRKALSDYVDFYYHRPELARRIRDNQCKLGSSEKGMFVLDVKGSSDEPNR